MSRDDQQERLRFGGRYALVEALGTSAVGGVFLSEDSDSGEPRAVKLLDVSVVSDEVEERFLAEARVLQQVRHHHVVRAFDHGRDHGFCWYAMEFLPGGSLRDRIRLRGLAPPEHALTAVFQVLMGLRAVHEVGLIHRDIKLTNVLLDSRGLARLTDFGVAHHPEGTVDFETVPGQALGTPGYGAPEQWEKGGDVGPAVDLFATGILLFRLITGHAPERMHLAQLRPVLIADLPDSVQDLLLTATRFDPADRFPDARTMAVDVSRARDEILGTREHEAWMAHFDAGGGPGAASLLPWLSRD